MGRSRGGLTTKIHALVDANGLPIALKLSEGQAHDGRSAVDMLAAIGPGQILLADRAYDSDTTRAQLAGRGAWANIKPLARRTNIPAFSPSSTASATWSSASSTSSNTSEPLQRALRNTTPTISPC
jgi:transposase